MKRILNLLCLSIVLVSCGTVSKMSSDQENVTVSLKKDCVAYNLHEKDLLVFRLETLWLGQENNPFPVITGRALENYNEWMAYIEDKPEYRNILSEKGVTYLNLSPNPDNPLYQEFVSQLAGYPTTYVVDSEGNIVGAPIIGNVKEQEDTLNQRLEQAADN